MFVVGVVGVGHRRFMCLDHPEWGSKMWVQSEIIASNETKPLLASILESLLAMKLKRC